MVVSRHLPLLFVIFIIYFVYRTHSFDGHIRLCGARLANKLNEVCKHYGGHQTPRNRRAAHSNAANNSFLFHTSHSLAPRYIQESQLESLFAGAAIGEPKMHSGIVDECCKNRCKLSTLLSYCAEPPREENADLERLFKEKVILFEVLPSEENDSTSRQLVTSGDNPPAKQADIADQPRQSLGTYSREKPYFIMENNLRRSNMNNDKFTF
ncbi:uncharacterized protein LOC118185033 [Stegodyphus dumicola]|uniref:uncharacterized protein LOC118185033 n=1 Tax=Stegodyphus dumicola TaxID=202533 RepID=UPI0015AAD4AD|nr:uncharacterized protein LOC118185033 [Stegodyphus dumicola]